MVEDSIYSRPLYTRAEAARILGVSPSTLGKWIAGYTYRTATGPGGQSPVIGSVEVRFNLTVSFDALAEAYVLIQLRAAGVPMQRIRPAVAELRREMGLEQALLSERLKTDGARVMFEYLIEDPGFDPAPTLLEVVSKQAVFAEAIQQYLRTISYSDNRIAAITLPQFGTGVRIDPRVNAGQPSLVNSGVRVVDITDRIGVGESVEEVASDFDLPRSEVAALVDA